jgi:arsenate reductase
MEAIMRAFITLLCAAVFGFAPVWAVAHETPIDQQKVPSAQGRSGDTREDAVSVLFMCPHGAGKSVLAAAYFLRLAKERGLNVRVDAAGTEPDPAVGPAVASHLTKNGYTVPVTKPRRVTPADLAKADVAVSLGCDLRGLPPPRGTLLKWDDVPGPGEDLTGADRAIRQHVEALVDELSRAKR